MDKTSHTLFPAHVPKLARIIKLLGGWYLSSLYSRIEFVINLDKGVILGPQDFDCSCSEHARERERIGYPDAHDEDYTFPALHIAVTYSMDDDEDIKGDDMDIEVALTARIGEEEFCERCLGFYVPEEGWEDGRWRVYGASTQQPYLPAVHDCGGDSEEIARQLVEEATAFDRENPVVDGALCLIEKQTPQELRTKFATHLWWKDLRLARREQDK
jgi:hypothetical protein